MKTLLNVVFFQILWVVCVGGAGKGYWWVGLPVMALFAAYHFSITPWKKADFLLMLSCIALGFVADSALVQLGLLRFEQAVPWAGFAPIWICLLWAGFALTLNHSMSYFQTRPIGAIIFGLLGGPLAYYIAANIWDAVTFSQPTWQVYAALAVIWAIMTPLLLNIGLNLKSKYA